MAEEQTEFAEGRPDLGEVKKMRREHPSGWLELTMDPARALLIDALLDSPPGYEFSPVEISPRAGISGQSVRNHIGKLVERGIVKQVGESKYKINDRSRVFREIERLNSAVTAIRSNNASTEIDGTKPEVKMDNSEKEDEDNDLIEIPPNENRGGIYAD
jgi:hypothetical protein